MIAPVSLPRDKLEVAFRVASVNAAKAPCEGDTSLVALFAFLNLIHSFLDSFDLLDLGALIGTLVGFSRSRFCKEEVADFERCEDVSSVLCTVTLVVFA